LGEIVNLVGLFDYEILVALTPTKRNAHGYF